MLQLPMLLFYYYYYIFPWKSAIFLKTHGLPECHPSFPLFLTNEPPEKVLPQLDVPGILLSDGTQ